MAVTSIVLTLLGVVGPVLGRWVTIIAAASALVAVLIHRWYARHPSHIPTPTAPKTWSPQINCSYTEVAGNVGGLILWWAACSSLYLVPVRRDGRRVHSCLGSDRMAHQASEVRPSGQSNRLALTRIVRVLGVALLVTQAVVAQPALQSVPTWTDPSSHHVRWIAVDSSVRLEVLEWGGSGRPLVLLGCYLTAHVHDEFAPKLTNQFHVYGITRRASVTRRP
jgi:hypothetical protein